jgi:3-oxoacyl-[acyl-carrier protein] reductase
VKGLAGRAFLVTGAASGMGRATCERLLAEGASVALVDRDAAVENVARRLASAGTRVLALRADVSADAEIAAAVERAAAELGGLRGRAGIFDPNELRPLAEVDPEAFTRTLDVNLRGTFLAMRYALPHLARDGGAIVTIASTAGLRGHGFGAGYTASKGGVIALTRLAAIQYGAQHVRANCVCPGFVSTGMTAHAVQDPEYVARIARGVPLGRIGQAEDLAGVICYLLSDDATYVTGQVLAADGGATAS